LDASSRDLVKFHDQTEQLRTALAGSAPRGDRRWKYPPGILAAIIAHSPAGTVLAAPRAE
jgi:hypothetical protein